MSASAVQNSPSNTRPLIPGTSVQSVGIHEFSLLNGWGHFGALLKTEFYSFLSLYALWPLSVSVCSSLGFAS